MLVGHAHVFTDLGDHGHHIGMGQAESKSSMMLSLGGAKASLSLMHVRASVLHQTRGFGKGGILA